jgi:hypothetical protein
LVFDYTGVLTKIFKHDPIQMGGTVVDNWIAQDLPPPRKTTETIVNGWNNSQFGQTTSKVGKVAGKLALRFAKQVFGLEKRGR